MVFNFLKGLNFSEERDGNLWQTRYKKEFSDFLNLSSDICNRRAFIFEMTR